MTVAGDETGWLIERRRAGRVMWWNGLSLDTFTMDANEAIRFARRVDAMTVQAWLKLDDCFVVEHLWAPPVAAGETGT